MTRFKAVDHCWLRSLARWKLRRLHCRYSPRGFLNTLKVFWNHETYTFTKICAPTAIKHSSTFLGLSSKTCSRVAQALNAAVKRMLSTSTSSTAPGLFQVDIDRFFLIGNLQHCCLLIFHINSIDLACRSSCHKAPTA